MKTKLLFLLILAFACLSVSGKPKKSKAFIIKIPDKFELVNTTKFNTIGKQFAYAYTSDLTPIQELNDDRINIVSKLTSEDAINGKLYVKPIRLGHEVEVYFLIDADVVIDTIVVAVYKQPVSNNVNHSLLIDNLFTSSNRTKLKPSVSIAEYRTQYYATNESYQNAQNQYNKLYAEYTTYLADAKIERTKRNEAKLLAKIEKEKQDSLDMIQRAKEKVIQDSIKYAKHQIAVLGTLTMNLQEPTAQLQTKELNDGSGHVKTYTYYVNEHGVEVKHGKYTEIMIFKDHKYWQNATVGFLYVTGTETLICHYYNDLLHGKYVYTRNVTTDTSFGNKRDSKYSYNLEMYKGFMTGMFEMPYGVREFKGKAVKGVIDYCTFTTIEGYHGKMESNCKNPTSYSGPFLDIFEREMLDGIRLGGIRILQPMFRFPIIGH